MKFDWDNRKAEVNLKFQDAEESWLHENRDAINAKIARGLDQLNSGKGISGDIARARLQERKTRMVE